MAAAHFTILKTDHHKGGVSEPDHILLEIAFDNDPVAAVAVEWHGDLELEIKVTKYFGGRTPGIVTAIELHQLVMETITSRLASGESDLNTVFEAQDKLICETIAHQSDKAEIPTLPERN